MRANNFRLVSTAIVLDPGTEANITPRMLVKCRALASVTAAVGNKIAVLQAGTLHTLLRRGRFSCIYFGIVMRSRAVHVRACVRTLYLQQLDRDYTRA